MVLKLDSQVTLPSVLVEMVQLKAQTSSRHCRWCRVQEHLEEGLHRCCGSSHCWQHHLVQEELELHHRQAMVHSSLKVLHGDITRRLLLEICSGLEPSDIISSSSSTSSMSCLFTRFKSRYRVTPRDLICLITFFASSKLSVTLVARARKSGLQ